ncbi:hypothetical protein HYU14_04765 [Candidatus Woesearchaeota archaeon]|nr:hypothetical protein [Candidatus Woesearchaeota archaeon]
MLRTLIALALIFIVVLVLMALFRRTLQFMVSAALFAVAFLIIGTLLFPDNTIFQKGKDYILEKGVGLFEKGKEKIIAYVVLDNGAIGNSTANDMPVGENFRQLPAE